MQCCAGALERVFLPFGWHGCSAARVERVFLPFGWHGCSAARVHLSGRAYRECEFPYNSRVLRGSGRTCTKPVKNHMICAFLRPLQGGKNQKKARLQDDRATNKQTNNQTVKHSHTQTLKHTNKQSSNQTTKHPKP